MKKQKILAMLLTICLILPLFPAIMASADDDDPVFGALATIPPENIEGAVPMIEERDVPEGEEGYKEVDVYYIESELPNGMLKINLSDGLTEDLTVGYRYDVGEEHVRDCIDEEGNFTVKAADVAYGEIYADLIDAEDEENYINATDGVRVVYETLKINLIPVSKYVVTFTNDGEGYVGIDCGDIIIDTNADAVYGGNRVYSEKSFYMLITTSNSENDGGNPIYAGPRKPYYYIKDFEVTASKEEYESRISNDWAGDKEGAEANINSYELSTVFYIDVEFGVDPFVIEGLKKVNVIAGTPNDSDSFIFTMKLSDVIWNEDYVDVNAFEDAPYVYTKSLSYLTLKATKEGTFDFNIAELGFFKTTIFKEYVYSDFPADFYFEITESYASSNKAYWSYDSSKFFIKLFYVPPTTEGQTYGEGYWDWVLVEKNEDGYYEAEGDIVFTNEYKETTYIPPVTDPAPTTTQPPATDPPPATTEAVTTTEAETTTEAATTTVPETTTEAATTTEEAITTTEEEITIATEPIIDTTEPTEPIIETTTEETIAEPPTEPTIPPPTEEEKVEEVEEVEIPLNGWIFNEDTGKWELWENGVVVEIRDYRPGEEPKDNPKTGDAMLPLLIFVMLATAATGFAAAKRKRETN